MRIQSVCMFGILLALCALGFAEPRASTDQTHSGRTLFEQELAAARKAGLPVSIRDVKQPLPPSGQNAADYYTAMGKLPISPEDWQTIEVLYTKFAPTPTEIGLARRLLSAHQAERDLVHKAVACNQCVLTHNWPEWPAEMVEFAPLRQAARWLSAESALQWLDGNCEDAAKTQALGFQIVRHAAEDRTLIANLVVKAVEEITLKGLRFMLLRSGEQPGKAQAVRSALETMGDPPSLAHTMGGELAGSLGEMGVEPNNPQGLYLRAGWPHTPFGHSVRTAKTSSTQKRKEWDTYLQAAAYELRLYRTIIPLLDLPYPQSRDQCREALRKLKPISTVKGVFVGDIMGDGFLRIRVNGAETEALNRTIQVGAAVLDYRAKTGSLPLSLEMVLPTVPLDPFDLKPLRYRLEGEGFIVYSAGETGKFDGGTAEARPKPRETLFRWPAPHYAL